MSHNIETLNGLPTHRLRTLHKEYSSKGTKGAKKEASVIKRIINTRLNEARKSKYRGDQGTVRIFPQTPQRESGTGKTYETFVSEMAYNRGQKGEGTKITGLERSGYGGKGSSLSGRGSDAVVHVLHDDGKRRTHTLELKEKGAAFGQVGYRHSPEKGWHYRGEDDPPPLPHADTSRMNPKQLKKHEKKVEAHAARTRTARAGRAIADELHAMGVHDHLNDTFGKPAGGSKEHHIAAVRSHGKELHVPLQFKSVEHAVRFMHKTMNKNDFFNSEGHGMYAFKKSLARKTGVPWLGHHIDPEAAKSGELLSMRHRVKTHSSAKEGKPASQSLTAQLNMDKQFLTPSHVKVQMAYEKKGKDITETWVPLDFSNPEAAAAAKKEMERRAAASNAMLQWQSDKRKQRSAAADKAGEAARLKGIARAEALKKRKARAALYAVNEMAQSRPRADQIQALLDREDITDAEYRRLVALSNKEKRSNTILYGKGGRKMKKYPSVTRGDVFRYS